MKLVEIKHRTTYRYNVPVELGVHELMLRPLDGARTSILESSLWISPHARVEQTRDFYGNVVEKVFFGAMAAELSFISRTRVGHRPEAPVDIAEAIASDRPLSMSANDAAMIALARKSQSGDQGGQLARWTASTVDCVSGSDFDRMRAMNERINDDFCYVARHEMGTQDPIETLRLGSGTCRDFAFLMVEAARTLGLPARYASGYLYDDETAPGELVGGRNTHAWAQVYLGGAGWINFDPTNDCIGRNLIASAVVMKPTEVVPVHGSYIGNGSEFVAMEIDVAVRSSPWVEENTLLFDDRRDLGVEADSEDCYTASAMSR